MRAFPRAAALFFAAAAFAEIPPLRTDFASPDEFAAHLRLLHNQLPAFNCAPLLSTLPPRWQVSSCSAHYELDTAPFRQLVSSCAEAKQRFADLAQLIGSSTNAKTDSTAGAKLQTILARREFHQNTRPSPIEELRRAIYRWIFEHLLSILGSKGAATAANIFPYFAIAAGSISLLYWAIRVARRQLRNRPADLTSTLAGPSPSTDWLALSHEAAAAQDYRRAIQAAYWAAISWMQGREKLPATDNRTPRDFLRTLTAARSPELPALTLLTRSLERFWYAGLPASAQDFSACLESLKEIGCGPA